MKSWNDVPFENLLVDSRDGEWGKGEREIGLTEAVVIRGTDFAAVNDPDQQLPHRWIKDHLVERKRLLPGDIVFEMAGGTSTQSTGRSALLKPALFDFNAPLPAVCASFSRHLRLDHSKFSPEFIYFLLQSLHRSGYMGVFHIQHTGVARFQYSSFKKHTILKIPDLPIQRKIAAILTAYDDLIEINKRRIALLEKMAEELYREWFVRMRFPGHQATKFVKGVPEGWEVAQVDTLGKVITGKTPSTSSPRYYDGNYPFIKTPDMHGNMFILETGERLSEEGLSSQPSQTIPENSLCVSCIGTGGIISITTKTSQTNQQINSIRLKRREDLEWGYYMLRSLKETIYLFGSTGTTMTNLSKGKFSKLKFFSPPTALRDDFHSILEPIFSEIQILASTNKTLTRTRDLLLPRLISGKLSVEDLDIEFPASMRDAPESGA